jgi:hypothetical protein
MPAAVRKVDIPKPKGGVRSLGIPMVLDRLIQQALHQVMQPLFEPEFSESSYGFRPGRNIKPWKRREATLPKVSAESWTWTWKSSSTASTTMY